MDPITHVLLGASLGYAAFGRKLGRSSAVSGGLAAFVPDADVFIRSVEDPLLAIEYHRHFTHSFAFAPLGALLVASLWIFRSRWKHERLNLWACCLMGYVSHCLLDASTSYGTQLFWPFSDHRAGWDLISIVDPLFSLALFIGLFFALIVKQRRAVLVSLGFAVFYLAFGGIQHSRAQTAQSQLAARRGHTIQRYEVMPTLANNVIWRTLYRHDGKIFSDRIRVGWFSAPTVIVGWSLPAVDQPGLSEVERARNRNRSFERFHWFSEGWVARKPDDESLLGDMRYSLSTEAFDPIWGIRFTPDKSTADVEWVNRSRDRQIDLKDLWEEVIGRKKEHQPIVKSPVSEELFLY